MDQAAHPSSARSIQASPREEACSAGWRGALTPLQSRPAAGQDATPLSGSAAGPAFTAPGGALRPGASSPRATSDVRETLRRAIARIEGPQAFEVSEVCAAPGWHLGCPEADRLLPASGLETRGVHEVKAVQDGQSASAAAWMTSIGFALRLAVRRVAALETPSPATSPVSLAPPRPWLMWCWPRHLSREFGAPSAAGLKRLGLDASRLIIVETASEAEALGALEEGLRSGSLALAFGLFDSVALTPSRRLSLMAQEHRTPCLIITHPCRPAAPAAATRWRVGRLASAPHPLVPRLPGGTRFSLALERCRARPASSAYPPLSLEWCDETRCFSAAAVLADQPAQPRRARSRSGA